MSANNLLLIYCSIVERVCPVLVATGRYFLLAAKESNQRKLQSVHFLWQQRKWTKTCLPAGRETASAS